MVGIDYINDETTPVVDGILEVLEETDDPPIAVAVFTENGMHLIPKSDASLGQLRTAHVQAAGLAEHFDRLVDEAAANASDDE